MEHLAFIKRNLLSSFPLLIPSSPFLLYFVLKKHRQSPSDFRQTIIRNIVFVTPSREDRPKNQTPKYVLVSSRINNLLFREHVLCGTIQRCTIEKIYIFDVQSKKSFIMKLLLTEFLDSRLIFLRRKKIKRNRRYGSRYYLTLCINKTPRHSLLECVEREPLII